MKVATCSRHRDLGRGTDAELPFTDLFGKGVRRGIDLKDAVNAFGADRVRCIGLSTEEGSTAAGRSAARSVSYVEVDMAGSDRSHRVPPARRLRAAVVRRGGHGAS